MSSGGYLYMCLGGQTIVDACLTSNLQANGHGLQGINCGSCDPCCGDLNRALGRGRGGGSIADAPWYDPDEPKSYEFAGLMVTSIDGLVPGAFTRPLSEAVGPGATLGPSRRLAPQITVTAIMLGSCCGVEYGLSWLTSALRGSCGGSGSSGSTLCAGDELEFLVCPPVFPDEDCVGDQAKLDECLAACGDNTGCQEKCQQRFDGFDFEEALEPYIRKFRNVALLSGPTVTQRISHGCPTCHDCPMIEVQFVLAAGDPNVYRLPIEIVDMAIFEDFDQDDCIEWIDIDSDIPCNDCEDAGDCATDPNCQDVPPPSMPQLTNSCIVSCLGTDRRRACFDIAEGVFPATGDGTLILEIFAGNKPLRNVQVLGWHNPSGADPDDLTECDACFGITASYVAADSTLVIDGTTRTSTIQCPGRNAVRANPFIAGDNGSPNFDYPQFTGCASGQYTVCVYAEDPVSNQAFVRVLAVGME